MSKRLVLFVAVVCLTVPTWAGSAGASTRARSSLAGTYEFHYWWQGNPNDITATLTLNPDHTATLEGGKFRWLRDGQSFTLKTHRVTYIGRKSRPGFNTKVHPGTMSDRSDSGIWYAVKTG